MQKEENNMRYGQETPAAKASWLFSTSTISFISAILAFVSFNIFLWFYVRRDSFCKWFAAVTALFVLASIITGVGWLVGAIISKKAPTIGRVLVTGSFLILVWLLLVAPTTPVRLSRARALAIQARLHRIHSAMRLYCDENEGRLPNAEHWADLLLKHDKQLSVDDFRYPHGKYGLFVFGFNRNVAGMRLSDIPVNTVLVIECEGVWNLAGGQELLESKLRKRDEFFVLKSSGAVHYTQILPDGTFTQQLRWEP